MIFANLSLLTEEAGKLLTFMGIQYALGRRGSFPYGLLVKFSLLKIAILVIVCDIIQTLFLLNFFNFFARRSRWLRRLREKRQQKQAENTTGKNRQWFKKIGNLSVLLIAALPYGGGALSGSLMAVTMKMDKRKAFLVILSGCILGTVIYFAIFTGILAILQ